MQRSTVEPEAPRGPLAAQEREELARRLLNATDAWVKALWVNRHLGTADSQSEEEAAWGALLYASHEVLVERARRYD